MRNILPFRSETVEPVALAEEVAIPQTVIYCDGQSNLIHCQRPAALYKNLSAFLSKFSNQSTTMVTEITKEQATQAAHNYESIEFNFRYSIPFAEFCNKNSIARTSGYNTIKNVTNIILSSGAKDSVIIKDGSDNKYYRIISETSWEWVDEFGGRNFAGDSVYTASQVLGVESDIYIPVSIKRKTEDLAFVYEQYVEGTNALKNVTAYIFGDTLSFVRKINDSFGNLTYMYGYGEKTVNVKSDGTLEYKNAAISSGSSNGFYADLQTAINFAANCGGWSTEINHPTFKLAFASKDGEDKNAGHTFYFWQEIDGEDIIAAEGPALKIVVEKGQVSNYVRHAVFATVSYEPKEDVLQAANAIASISTEEYQKYLESISSGAAIDEVSAYSYTANQIQRIRTCYKPEEGALVPSWCIDFIDGGRTWIGLKQKQF